MTEIRYGHGGFYVLAFYKAHWGGWCMTHFAIRHKIVEAT